MAMPWLASKNRSVLASTPWANTAGLNRVNNNDKLKNQAVRNDAEDMSIGLGLRWRQHTLNKPFFEKNTLWD
jgi:hypothetical protein